MRYLKAKIAQDEEDYLYRVYITDSLRLHGENKYLTRSWSEIIKPQKKEKARSAEEIIAAVIENGGLTITEGGEEAVVSDSAGEADTG